MNTIYRIVWNAATGKWVVASELAKGRKKQSTKSVASVMLLAGMVGGMSLAHRAEAQVVTLNPTATASCATPGNGSLLNPAWTNGTSVCGTAAGEAAAGVAGGSAFGDHAATTGSYGTALGAYSLAGTYATAMGVSSMATGSNSLAAGVNSQALGNSAIALGANATANAIYSTAIGRGATAGSAGTGNVPGSTAIGYQSSADGGTTTSGAWSGTAVGTHTIALGDGATAFGDSATANADRTAAFGRNAQAIATEATAFGANTVANQSDATAIGFNAQATAQNATAIGANSVANVANTVSVGSVGSERNIVNVAAGINPTDAVNVSQLEPVVAGLGGGASIDPTTGAVTGPTYNVQGGTQTDVGTALDALDAGVNNRVAYDQNADGTTNYNSVTLGNGQATGPVALHNVAPGELSATSADAVNGSQLWQTNQNVANVSNNLTDATRYFKANGLDNGTDDASASGSYSVASGANANASDIASTAIGANTVASGNGAIAIGGSAGEATAAQATAHDAIAIGENSSASTESSLAIGANSNVSSANSVALGANSAATRDNTVSVGAVGSERQVVNMAAGVQSTDAVNVSQLAPAVAALGGGASIDPTTGAVTGPAYNVQGGTQTDVGTALDALDAGVNNRVAYDQNADGSTNYNSVTLGNGQSTGPVALHNVAPGELSATSTDAVNGSQLYATNQQVAQNTGDITNLGNRVTTNEGDITTLQGQMADAVMYDDSSHSSVTLGGTSATSPVGLHNVAAGTANTDAVNVSQLAPAVAALGGGALIDPTTGAVTGPTYNVQGGTQTSVGAALDALDSGVNNRVAYDQNDDGTTNYNSVTLGNGQSTGPVALHNVAPGELSATSTDAVNGSQLYATNQQVGQNTSDITNLGNQVNQNTSDITGLQSQSRYFQANGSGGADQALASAVGATAAGPYAQASAAEAVAVGNMSNASATDATAVGARSQASGNFSTALGAYANASSDNGIAIGNMANVSAGGATGAGYNAAIGYYAQATGDYSIALGTNASATGNNSVALGNGALATRDNVISVGGGSPANPNRQVVNMAAGTQQTDAVNVSQLAPVVAGLGGSASIDPTTGAVTGPTYNVQGGTQTDVGDALDALDAGVNNRVAYDQNDDGTTNYNSVTLGNGQSTVPVALHNVAPGELSATSTDAVNGSQLYATNQQVAQNTTDISNLQNGVVADMHYFKANGLNDGTDDAQATGSDAIAVGPNATASGTGAVAMGSGANAQFANSVAIGTSATTTYPNAVAIGYQSTAAQESVALGHGASAINSNDTAIGSGTMASLNSTAIGQGATAASSSVAIGQGAMAVSNSTAIGNGAMVSPANTNAVALGAGSMATRNNTVSVGAAGSERQVVNMAAGVQSTDAVNVSQLAPAVAALGGGASIDPTTGAVTGPTYNVQGGTQTDVGTALDALDAGVNNRVAYDQNADGSTNYNSVTLGNGQSTGPVALHNVAPGELSTTSTDAVNGSQLYATNQQVAQNTGDITNLGNRVTTNEGDITTLQGQMADAVMYDDSSHGSVTLGGTSATAPVALHNVAAGELSATSNDAVNGSQLYATNQQVAQNTGDITDLQNNFDNGTIGLVQQDPSTGNITVAAGKNGSLVDFTGTEGARQLTGVAAGNVSATSVDAVNGSQLYATNQQVAQNTGDITNLGDRVTTNEGDITTLQGQMADAVLYDDSTHGSVTLGGTSATAPVALHNVAAGELSATSTDAVNGSQLYATNQQVSQNTTDISNLQSGIVADTRYFKADGKNDGTDDAQVTAGSNSVAIGANSVADRANTVSVGAAGAERQITNVAAGTEDTDAVNVSQLKSSGLIDGSGNAVAAVTYDQNADGSPNYNSVTMGGGKSDGPVTIKNVAAGTDDTDAVNVGQLKSAGLVDNSGNTLDAVVYDPGSNRGQVTLGGVGAAAPVVLTNVANGVNQYDAVNFGQLSGLQSDLQNQINTVNGQVTNIDNRVTTLESNGGGNGGGTPEYVAANPSTQPTAGANVGDTTGVALGYNTAATGDSASAIGDSAQATGDSSTAAGSSAVASSTGATALGSSASVNASNGVAVGNNATVASSASNGTAVGSGSSVSAASGTAVGQGASVASTATNSVALGAGSVATQANSVSVGSAGNERTITNVAAGVNATDAANVGQLQASQNWAQSYVDQKASQLNSRITNVGRRADAGTAGAIAMTNIPQAFQPNQSSIGAGVGAFNGQAAIAVGMSTITPGGRWVLKGSLTGTTQGDVGVGFGASMVW